MLELATKVGRARTQEGLFFAAESVVWDAEPGFRSRSERMRKFRDEVESAIGDDWADVFVWIETSASYLEAVCSTLAEDANAPERIRRAEFEVSRRAVAVTHEVLALLRAGLPDGAHARWRTLYELGVVAHVLACGNRGTSSRYLAHRVLVTDADERYGEHDPEIAAEARRIRRRFKVPFKGIYGWASELTGRRLGVDYPRLHHLEAIAGENTARLRDLHELAHHHIHAGALGNVLAKSGPSWSITDPWRLAVIAAVTADAAAEVGVAATLAVMHYGAPTPRILQGLHYLGLELSTMGATQLGRTWDLPRLNELAARMS